MRLTVVLLLSLISVRSLAQNFSGGFSFFLPPGDSSAQRFLPEFPAVSIGSFVGADASGHFTANGRRIRFWGANVTTGANFPLKEKAPFVAARLRKMGFNLLRFHHMDNPWSDNNGSIFNQNASTTRTLNPQSLDRLHFFLAQLKRNGVYADLNLHVSRTFKSGDGVLYPDSLPEFGKAVTLFDRQLIALQKEYARQLLTTVNPYTGLAPAQDPVVGLVEISNENTLYGYWKDGWLKPYADGGNLARRHVDTLDQRWQAFLQQKYPTQQALAAAWNAGVVAGGQNEQILDGTFELGNLGAHWILELHDAAAATMNLDSNNPYQGQRSARVVVTNTTGTDWHIQFKQAGGSVVAGKAYLVRFAARAAQNATLSATLMRDNAPYTWYAGASFNLTPQWKIYSFTVTAPEDNAGALRLSFSFNNQTGQFWFDQVSVAEPEVQGLLPGESLAAGNIRRIDYSERLQFTPGRMADMAEFYLSLQRAYFADMRQYLRDSLGVQVPITGSNAWGGPSDLYTQQDMDFADDHAYWDHPQFPGQPWSPTDWRINNTPMVKSPDYTTLQSIFSGLALKGKPYTVSEYRHPFPNRYEVEMMPWLAAYAGFHDADGLMFFEYNGFYDNWETDRIEGYFPIHRHPVHMGLSPVFAYAFREGLIGAAQQVLNVQYSDQYLFALPKVDNQGRWGKFLPYDSRLALTQAIRTSFGGNGAPDLAQLPAAPGSVATTSNGQTSVDFDKGLLRTVCPQFVSVCGVLNQPAPTAAGPLNIAQGSGFGAVAWLALDNQSLSGARESLLAIASKAQNSGMVWTDSTTVNDHWGAAPTAVYPLQVTLDLQIDADSLRLYPLDATGATKSSTVALPVAPGRFRLALNQSVDKTLWYGLEALRAATGTQEGAAPAPVLTLSPNPAHQTVRIALQLPEASTPVVRLLDMQGHALRTLYERMDPVRAIQVDCGLEGLAPGAYMVELRSAGQVWVKKLLVQ